MIAASGDAGLAAMIRRPGRFELGALLKALMLRGFEPHEIRFEGFRELGRARGPLVRRLTVETKPRRRVTIELNAGLLSASSPLPGYFRDFAERLPNPDPFVTFLGFWDGALLKDQVYCALPSLWGQSVALGRCYQRRLGLANPVALHWVFRGAFPELQVEICRAQFPLQRTVARARVGGKLDGRAVLGGQFLEQQEGFRIRLHAQSERCEGVRDWESEALRRLRLIEPQLRRVRRPLAVVMQFDRYRHGQTLVAPGSDRPQLGVRPWLLGDPKELYGPGEILLRGPWPPD